MIIMTCHSMCNKDEPEKRRCSVDPGHMVPENKLDQHEWYCSRMQAGYTRQELVSVMRVALVLLWVSGRDWVIINCDRMSLV